MKIKNFKKYLMMSLMSVSAWAVTPATPVAEKSIKSQIQKLNWNGIDVVYIEDARFPTYDMVMYFADGALSDGKTPGLTEHAFNLLDSGTNKFTQKEILDQMEFLGTEFGVDVTHEYTTLNMSGLSKDLDVAMKQACHLLREANYPKDVVKQEIEKEKSGLINLVANPQALADRVYREVSLAGTPYSYPVSGKLKDLDLYSAETLRSQSNYFLDKVKKRIYLTGPKSILSIEKTLVNDCKLKGSIADFERKITYKNPGVTGSQIVFVPIPEANQVQVKVGRFLNRSEINQRNLDALASDLLGGGFTSRLMREVRVKRGLTYSIGSYISSQKEYGRAGISTFTKNETINPLVEVIYNTVKNIMDKGITSDELDRIKSGLKGSHPFKFESNKTFLVQLLYLDHVGQSYDELFDFNQKLDAFTATEVREKIKNVFDPKKQSVFILGDKKIEGDLKKLSKKYGKLKVLDFKSFI